MFRRPSPQVSLVATATAVTLAFVWFGTQLVTSGRAADRQRLAERLEGRADVLEAGIRGTLAEAGERLNRGLLDASLPVVENAVVFGVTRGVAAVSPAGALPFQPTSLPVSVLDARLRAAEVLEARVGAPAAMAVYREMIASGDPTIRGAALLRFGGALRKQGDVAGALDAYRRLKALGTTPVDGYPAELAALEGERLTFSVAGHTDSGGRVTDQIIEAIDAGRWPLSRAMAHSFRETSKTPAPESWHLADALADLWQEWSQAPPQPGLRIGTGHGRSIVLLWRARAADVIALAAFADRFLPLHGLDVAFELTDSEGTRIAGTAAPAHAVTRITGERSFWRLRVWEHPSAAGAAPVTVPDLAMAVGATAVAFLWMAVYVSGRALRREAQTSQLQSDFVAAVSHEFRSPLTTIRQLSELLEMGEAPNAERRRTYYELMARESRRLQRLVETLLNFGRMEAGRDRYRRDPVNVGELVRQVARDVDALYDGRGARIVTEGPDADVCVTGDADALGLAVRNLLDNAIKYSPGAESVYVAWTAAGGEVSIRVVDRGLGIHASERDAIFGKFVRGAAAAAANVKGTGVGLSMVRHVLAAHGGRVSVESETGRGSTFTVTLPAAR